MEVFMHYRGLGSVVDYDLLKDTGELVRTMVQQVPENELSEGILMVQMRLSQPYKVAPRGAMMMKAKPSGTAQSNQVTHLELTLRRDDRTGLTAEMAPGEREQSALDWALDAMAKTRCRLFPEGFGKEPEEGVPLPTGFYRFTSEMYYLQPMMMALNTSYGQLYAGFAHNTHDYVSAQNQRLAGAFLLYTVAQAMVKFSGEYDPTLYYGVAGLHNYRELPETVWSEGERKLERFSMSWPVELLEFSMGLERWSHVAKTTA